MDPRALDLTAIYTFTIICLTIIVLLYFLPSIVAHKKVDAGAIQRLNLYLGWTGIGWIASLIWAFRAAPKTTEAQVADRFGSKAVATPLSPSSYGDARYTLKEEVKLVGKTFYIYNSKDEKVLWVDMKPFKLREDIRFYLPGSGQTEVLRIKAREILDVGATYDVMEVDGQKPVGAVQRRWLQSTLRDKWVVMDRNGQELLTIQEDTWFRALLRRFIGGLLFPATYSGTARCASRPTPWPTALRASPPCAVAAPPPT